MAQGCWIVQPECVPLDSKSCGHSTDGGHYWAPAENVWEKMLLAPAKVSGARKGQVFFPDGEPLPPLVPLVLLYLPPTYLWMSISWILACCIISLWAQRALNKDAAWSALGICVKEVNHGMNGCLIFPPFVNNLLLNSMDESHLHFNLSGRSLLKGSLVKMYP